MARPLSWHDDPLEDVFEFRAPPPRAPDEPEPEPPPAAPAAWREWLLELFPRHVSKGFATYHEEFWEWESAVRAGVRPQPFVGIWPREGGKSSSVELGTVRLGLTGRRTYVWYCRETQERADDAVSNIGALLESSAVDRYYPVHAQRRVGKYGSARAWRRNRLHTAGGFIVDAVGLDTARRGVKIEEKRPDLIIFDDIDDKLDSAEATKKKRKIITASLLPAGQVDALAVIAVQNLIIPHGIFAQLADGRADFLIDRIVSGPYPAIVGLKTESKYDESIGRVRTKILAGTPTWQGQDLDACQKAIDNEGLTTFIEERQHQVHERTGALWTKALLNDHRRAEAPTLKRVVVGVDPSGGGDEIGIIVAGLGHDDRGYVIADFSVPGARGALHWGHETVRAFDEREADRIVAERNFGGDMVESNIKVAAGNRRMPVHMVTASRGKAVRAEPVSALYENGAVSHVGTFPELEAELTGWVPGDPRSPNRLDALVWCLTELMLGEKKQVRVYFPGMEKAS
jgi:hypothetical protein